MTDETRLCLLEQSHTHINETLLRLERKFDKIESDNAANLKWLGGVVITIGLALAGWIHLH